MAGSHNSSGMKDQIHTFVIGQLRMHGLIFVGHTTVAGRKCKVAVIPKDLREPLSLALLSALQGPGAT